MNDQFDLFSSRTARNRGVNRVAQHNRQWREKCQSYILATTFQGTEMSGEDIRRKCQSAGLYPTHHNAWGALIMHLVRSKAFSDTGKRTHMKDKRSHARKTPIYIRS